MLTTNPNLVFSNVRSLEKDFWVSVPSIIHRFLLLVRVLTRGSSSALNFHASSLHLNLDLRSLT